jgi:hypothetical protein
MGIMTDRDPVIRDAFQDDASTMEPAHQDRLWTEMMHRKTRQIRRRYIARAGVVLVAGAAVGGFIALRSVSRSSAPDAVAIAADSIPDLSPSEPTVIQEPPRETAPSSLIPLLGHRSSLQMDITRYESQIDALAHRLNQTSGQEHDVLTRQLRDFEEQLLVTKKALAVVDRELSGHQGVQVYSSVPVPPEAPIIFGGPFTTPDEVMYMAGGLGGGLLLVSLALLVYMRRIARTTREALAQVESQISSQHATLASGIDAIALEVERLGEGQRFMSRVLSKGDPQAREATS